MKLNRSLLPWVAAVLIVSAIAVGVSIIISLHPSSPQEKQPIPSAEQPLSIVEQPSIGNSILSTLPLSPSSKGEEKLIAAMIENHVDARPLQEGLREAIAVFELISEGDITRFMAFYRADVLPKRIGPVRSLRPHFVSLARAYDPLLLHAGGSQLAYDALKRYNDIEHHDGIRYDGETYERDPRGEAPHNLFISRENILEVLEGSQVREQSLPLFESESGIKNQELEQAKNVSIDFGSEEHNVEFSYNSFRGTYARSIFGAKKQATPKNVLILEAHVDGFNQIGYVPWTQTFGSGKATLFTKGKMFEGTWNREKNERFVLTDANGNPLPISKGQVWATMVPMMSMVSW